jgi:hypothetical protein
VAKMPTTPKSKTTGSTGAEFTVQMAPKPAINGSTGRAGKISAASQGSTGRAANLGAYLHPKKKK